MSCMLVHNFEALGHVTSVLEPENPPRKFGVKSSLSQKRLKYGKNIFHMVICLKIPFHPNQPTFGRDEVYFFVSFFFFLIYVRSSSPKPQHIRNLLFVQSRWVANAIFLPKFFGETSPGTPQKINFFEWLKLECQFFLISVDI